MNRNNPDLLPSEFGDVDARDTHATPGKEKHPYPPIEAPSDATYSGASPVITPTGRPTGAGGSLPGDPRTEVDGFEVNPPERDADEDILKHPREHVSADDPQGGDWKG